MLKGYWAVMEKEIFLAFGEGTGLVDITSFTAFV